MRAKGKAYFLRFAVIFSLLLQSFVFNFASFSTQPVVAANNCTTGSYAPVLLVYNDTYSSNKFGLFLGEILRAEGFNLYDVATLSSINSGCLANYDSVLLAETSLTSTQAGIFSQYVQNGGNLLAMRPDSQLAAVFGLGSKTSTLNNGYMAIQTNTPYGQGFTNQSLQLHTAADQYSNTSSQVIALLYSNSTTATSYPAAVVNNYGAGTAAAFTYDLASAVVYLRQGNPAQADTDADGDGILRIVDMYYNWIDLNKMPLPQADLHQRLFARVLGKLNANKKPLPRFWYFPNGKNTAVVLTSDAHGNPDSYYANLISSMNKFNALTTFYMSQASQPSASNVTNWKSQGYGFSTHPYEVDTPLATGYDNVDSWFDLNYGTRTSRTVRVHRVQWQGWVDGAKIGAARGYSMDYTYYRYGAWLLKGDGTWARGYMTGSGLPMKLIDASGQIVNNFGQYTTITDDQMLAAGSGPEGLNDTQAYQYTKQAIDASEAGDNQALAMQMHVDYYSAEQTWAENTLSYTRSLNIPIFSGDNWYNFTQNRYDSAISGISWSGSQLSFTVNIPANQTGQTLMLPLYSNNGGSITGVKVNGVTAAYTNTTVRGENFAFVTLPAGSSTLVVSYPGGTNPPPTITGVSPATVVNNANTTITITGSNFLATPTVQLGSQYLSGVTQISSTNLSAVVPAGMNLGSYSLTVMNPDGQSVTQAQAVTVALPPPSLSVLTPTFGSNAAPVSLSLSGTNFVNGAGVKLGASSLGTATFNSATSLSTVVPQGFTAGTYDLTVTNPDGQSSTLASAYTVGDASDVTAPVISAVSATNISSSGATIGWTTNERATTQIDYGTTTAYGSQTTLNTSLLTSHSQTLTGLAGNTTYHYRVRSTDPSGNTAISGDFSFATPPATPVLLVGDQNIEPQPDNNLAGTAEAFQYTAVASGPANQLSLYVDSSNTATTVVLGLYNNNASDNPGTLLGQVTISNPVKGSWNTASLPGGISISSGQKYWIAVLGPVGAGTVQFRDVSSGSKAQGSSQTNLSSLPATWSAGSNYFNSPMAAYVVQLGSAGPDTQPPTITMTAPLNGATVTGKTVQVSASASDNVGVSSVQFLLDGNSLGTALTTAPYSINWDSTTVANGTHTLSARASDAAGNTATATSITVTVSNTPPDTQPPVVSITAPLDGATLTGTAVTVSASASDNVGVSSVQFLLDGNSLGTALTTAPYSINWNTTTATNGNHTLSARASDAAGNTATATSITVTINNPPIISGVAASAISTTGATISWNTNIPASSQVEYGLTNTYGSSTALDSALVTIHSQNISGLTASTTYHYRVRSVDSSGNVVTSPDNSFTTASTTPITLIGDTKIEALLDSNPAGKAEAFQYTALASGQVSKLYVYIDGGSAATSVVVGLYNNDGSNNPGTLLGQATITNPVKGAWNSVTMPVGINLSSGQKYWIAILSPSGVGKVQFRDVNSSGKAQVSSQNNLSSLPATWSPGVTYSDSPMSAYATS